MLDVITVLNISTSEAKIRGKSRKTHPLSSLSSKSSSQNKATIGRGKLLPYFVGAVGATFQVPTNAKFCTAYWQRRSDKNARPMPAYIRVGVSQPPPERQFIISLIILTRNGLCHFGPGTTGRRADSSVQGRFLCHLVGEMAIRSTLTPLNFFLWQFSTLWQAMRMGLYIYWIEVQRH